MEAAVTGYDMTSLATVSASERTTAPTKGKDVLKRTLRRGVDEEVRQHCA